MQSFFLPCSDIWNIVKQNLLNKTILNLDIIIAELLSINDCIKKNVLLRSIIG